MRSQTRTKLWMKKENVDKNEIINENENEITDEKEIVDGRREQNCGKELDRRRE